MGKVSGIEWCDATWNPVVGCSKVSPGCANCYAETLAMRWGWTPKPWLPEFAEENVVLKPKRLTEPLKWREPLRIFVNSLSDLHHELVPQDFLDKAYAVMALTSHHTFQLLTKRPGRMAAYLRDPATEDRVWQALMEMPERKRYPGYTDRWEWPLPNLWVGTSVENARWRTRIDDLRSAPAAVRFLSCEPLLGPLADPDEPFTHEQAESGQIAPFDLTGIDWVIIGGESGPGARPMQEKWVRDIVAACQRQHVAPFVKQMGQVWSSENLGHNGHGEDITKFPEDLQIRKYPHEQHEWVDMRNELVESGEMCLACGAIRSGNVDSNEAVLLGL